MEHAEIRRKFRAFMEARGHRWVNSSPLLPDDPSVLFTTAGMQQFKPYYTGAADAQADFGALSTASVQKCVRTGDIDEVGDERHLTFFEMLGNFSFGGYFKKEAIQYAYEFVTQEMGLKIDYVTVFAGEPGVPEDTESVDIWKSLDPSITIKKFDRADNFWGPTGDEGPCGPTTEIYVDGIEIWNVVFNQYYQKKDKTLEPLATPGIDTGMGLERLSLVSQFPGQAGEKTVFDTDLFQYVFSNAGFSEKFDQRARRILADHTRAIGFMITDGVRPSNKDQGYILRRLIRRVVTLEYLHGSIDFGRIFAAFACDDEYGSFYKELEGSEIEEVFSEEKQKFLKTLKAGLKEVDRLESIDASVAFKLYESHGLPFEVIKDVAGPKADALTHEAFDAKFKEHQEKSRAGAEKKFGGHGLLLDTGELKAANEEELKIVTRLHTTTHLLHAALRKVLGKEVGQAGSDITAERTRFDFTFPRKLTEEEIKQVEDLVNDAIAQDLPMTKVTLPKEEAEKSGALYFFKNKYPAMVDVYTVGGDADWFSKEFCGGPHVTHTGEIGRIKITKEEAVSAGVRRIRASLVS